MCVHVGRSKGGQGPGEVFIAPTSDSGLLCHPRESPLLLALGDSDPWIGRLGLKHRPLTPGLSNLRRRKPFDTGEDLQMCHGLHRVSFALEQC